jgi:hypothetical protein
MGGVSVRDVDVSVLDKIDGFRSPGHRLVCMVEDDGWVRLGGGKIDKGNGYTGNNGVTECSENTGFANRRVCWSQQLSIDICDDSRT